MLISRNGLSPTQRAQPWSAADQCVLEKPRRSSAASFLAPLWKSAGWQGRTPHPELFTGSALASTACGLLTTTPFTAAIHKVHFLPSPLPLIYSWLGSKQPDGWTSTLLVFCLLSYLFCFYTCFLTCVPPGFRKDRKSLLWFALFFWSAECAATMSCVGATYVRDYFIPAFICKHSFPPLPQEKAKC